MCKPGEPVRLRIQPLPPCPMRLLATLTPVLVVAACAVAGRASAPKCQVAALAPLPRVTRVVLTDVPSGARLGVVQRVDSVAALVGCYTGLAAEWEKGAAPSPEIRATFYQDSVPVASLTLGSGAFETRVGGRLLHRPAGPEEALAFARLAGVPVKHGPSGATMPLLRSR